MTPTFTPAFRTLAVAALLALPALANAQTEAKNPAVIQALNALQSRSASLGLLATDAADAAVTSQHADARNGIVHVYLRQRVQGIEVYGAVANVHMTANGQVVSLHSSFRPNVQVLARGAAPTPKLSAPQAVAAAARALGMPAPSALTILKAGSAAEGMEFNDGGISLDKIPVKLMYLPLPDGSLRLVWDVTLAPLSNDHYWNARVDASSGALLDKSDFTVSDDFSMLNLTRPFTQAAATIKTTPATAARTAAAAPNSYNVWPLTVESPIHGDRQLVSNPADKSFSPFGWHDTDGATGAEYTITRGNNVHAYDDASNNGNSSGTNYSPEGGKDLVFDFPFDALKPAPAKKNLDAAITNLFYWNNLMHDVMAHKGFDEASGNFQSKNYSGEGKGNDHVRAEAQDGSTSSPANLNNANFTTPSDGSRPRMQMYLWDRSELTVNVTAPASLAGSLTALEGSLGRKLQAVGPVKGKLVVADDGSAIPEQGCNAPLVNAAAISGNIALIERGTCGFALKVKNAQAAGAQMAIVMDNKADSPLVRMGGDAPDSVGLRIPSIFISQKDGQKLKVAARAGQVITISASGEIFYRDGDFDNSIIAHEYGHGISTRLTGGAAQSGCLGNAEQMGEGWSDFFALWMTTKPGDVGTTGRGIGTYASFEETSGPGIRPTRYSTDFKINPSTYALMGTGIYALGEDGKAPVHNIGYLWASTLWDLNWALVEKHGYNSDLKASTGGNNIALQLVMDGLKLQPCSPGFIDGRDAILMADQVNNKGVNADIIWQVFARRGMGFSAKQGSSNDLTDQVSAYDLPIALSSSKQLNEKLLDVYPNPAREQVLIRTQVSSSAPVQVELVSLLGQRVFTQTIAAARLQQQGLVVNTAAVAPGLYVVRLTTSEGTITKKLLVQH